MGWEFFVPARSLIGVKLLTACCCGLLTVADELELAKIGLTQRNSYELTDASIHLSTAKGDQTPALRQNPVLRRNQLGPVALTSVW